ncbi:MAG: GGDEF domain-containing protein [Actinomycetota bacterium]|nr:GGDEF domain-containing protein [Actinomycetota bacterium]
MGNLLANREQRLYFKDRESRFLLVSAGWLLAEAPGRTAEQILGKTDFEIFSEPHARAALEDERRIIATGQAVVEKVERETYSDRPDKWVSTTKLPLRDESGTIVGTYGISRDVTMQIAAERALAHQALHDPVTGLANRFALQDRLTQALLVLERQPGGVALAFVDLDDFKSVNDTCGHDAGDEVLVAAGERLGIAARRGDTVARYGGDAFVLLCPLRREGVDVGTIGRRLVRSLRAPVTLASGSTVAVTGSVGIARSEDAGDDPETLLQCADRAMYDAKAAGGNCLRVFDAGRHTSLPTGRRIRR